MTNKLFFYEGPLQGSTALPLHCYSTALMINTDNVLISNQDVHVICTILTVYVGLSVLIEFPIPVTLLSMVKYKHQKQNIY